MVGRARPSGGSGWSPSSSATGTRREIRQWVKDRLRSAKTPDTIVFRAELPKTDTGKLLRRTLLAELEATHARSRHWYPPCAPPSAPPCKGTLRDTTAFDLADHVVTRRRRRASTRTRSTT